MYLYLYTSRYIKCQCKNKFKHDLGLRNVKTKERKNTILDRGLVIFWQLARVWVWLKPICHSTFLLLLPPSCYPAFWPTSKTYARTHKDLQTSVCLGCFSPDCLLTNSYSSLKTEFNTLSSRMPSWRMESEAARLVHLLPNFPSPNGGQDLCPSLHVREVCKPAHFHTLLLTEAGPWLGHDWGRIRFAAHDVSSVMAWEQRVQTEQRYQFGSNKAIYRSWKWKINFK